MLWTPRWQRSFIEQVCWKGGAPAPVGPSQEERDLQRTQTEILRENQTLTRESIRQQELLAPLVYKSMGVKPIIGPDGKITGFEEIAGGGDPNKALKEEIEKGFLERTQRALRGELPVDVGLMNDLRDQEQSMNEVLRRNLGSGYETSSAGIEARKAFDTSKGTILDAARRGDLTVAEQLSLAREMQSETLDAGRIARLAGVPGLNQGGIETMGRIAGGFGQISGQMAADRANMNQMNMQAYQIRQQGSPITKLLGGIGGSVAGAATTYGMAAVF